MDSQKGIMLLLIAFISVGTVILGFPQFYYAAALMIALLVRAIRDSRGLLTPIESIELNLPIRPRMRRPATVNLLSEGPHRDRSRLP